MKTNPMKINRSVKPNWLLLTITMLGTPVLLSAALVSADDHQNGQRPDPATIVERLDSDGDKLISLNEFKLPRRGAGRLEEADADGDGNITLEEMETGLAQHLRADEERARERFGEADVNDDQVITPEELRAKMFARIDANQDGYLSIDEFAAMPPRSKKSSRKGGRGDAAPRTENDA